jgi:hypothetical protein
VIFIDAFGKGENMVGMALIWLQKHETGIVVLPMINNLRSATYVQQFIFKGTIMGQSCYPGRDMW